MGTNNLLLTDYDCFNSCNVDTDGSVVISTDQTAREAAKKNGYDVRQPEDYLTDTENLISDADYDRMRNWIKTIETHRGINIGHQMQNSFIFLFGEQFIRSFRTLRIIIMAEKPQHVFMFTTGRALYDSFRTGDKRFHPPSVRMLCERLNISLTTSYAHTLTRLKNLMFRAVGPTSLSAFNILSGNYIRLRDEQPIQNPIVMCHLSNVNNLDVIKPVLVEIQRRGISALVTYQSHGSLNYGRSELKSVSETLPTPVYPFEIFGGRDVRHRIQSIKQDLKKEWTYLDKTIESSEFELDEVPVWKAIREQFWLYYNYQLPRVCRYIETGLEALNHINPDVVLLKADGPTPVRTVTNIANEQAIPTVLVQHGLQKPIKDYIPDSSHIAAWGKRSSSFFESKGIEKDRLHITGAPHLDPLHCYNCNQTAIKRNLNIPEDDDIVMLVSQPFSDEVRSTLITAAVDSINQLDNISLILRPHPREDSQLHERAAQKSPEDVVIAPDSNIHDLVTTSDLVLAVNSTVILEACILDTPVILLTFTTEDPNPYYCEKNGFPEINDPANLGVKIHSVIDSDSDTLASSQPSLGWQFAHNADGQATQRVVNLIERLV
jgi:UDP-N-acetylglucosamine 2-epimerase